jgi:hypothetical protein
VSNWSMSACSIAWFRYHYSAKESKRETNIFGDDIGETELIKHIGHTLAVHIGRTGTPRIG